MKRICIFIIIALIFCLYGCQPPQQGPVPAGLKITDIQDTSLKLKEAEFLINFRVLAYLVDPNSLKLLSTAYAGTASEIRFQDVGAFYKNGFIAAVIPHEEGSKVARVLNTAGAIRTGQTLMGIPPGTTEVLSSEPINQQQTIEFLTAAGRAVSHTFLQGSIGWTVFADSSAIPDTIVLKMVPAYWQIGAEDIRTKLGQPPVDFKNFEIAGFQTRLKEGDLILLAPTTIMKEGTLNAAMFAEPGKRPKARCFVIICESAGL